MPPRRHRERTREIRRLKIRDQKYDRATGDYLVQVIKGGRRVGPTSHRIEEQNFTNDSQRVRAPFLRRNEKLEPIAEKQQTYFVIVANRAESEKAGDFCREFALGL